MHARHVPDGQDVPGVRDDLAGQADQDQSHECGA